MQQRVYQDINEQFEAVYDWNATKRYWRCHRPVAQASP